MQQQVILCEVSVAAPAGLLNVGYGINDDLFSGLFPALMQVCSHLSHSVSTTFSTLPDILFRMSRISARSLSFPMNSVPSTYLSSGQTKRSEQGPDQARTEDSGLPSGWLSLYIFLFASSYPAWHCGMNDQAAIRPYRRYHETLGTNIRVVEVRVECRFFREHIDSVEDLGLPLTVHITFGGDAILRTRSAAGASRGSHCRSKSWVKQNRHSSSVTTKFESLCWTDLMSRRGPFDFST
jgi:hypothetical protein